MLFSLPSLKYQQVKCYFSFTSFAFGLNKETLTLSCDVLRFFTDKLKTGFMILSSKVGILTGRLINKLRYGLPAQTCLLSTRAEMLAAVLMKTDQLRISTKEKAENVL